MATERERNRGGKFLPDSDSRTLDERALELHYQKRSYRQIAAELGISLASAHERVKRSLGSVPVPGAAEAVQQMLNNLHHDRAILEEIRDRLMEDFERGRLIPDPEDEDGPAIEDPEYRLKVSDRIAKYNEQLQKNDESLRRLLGADRPTQQHVSAEVTYTILGLGDE